MCLVRSSRLFFITPRSRAWIESASCSDSRRGASSKSRGIAPESVELIRKAARERFGVDPTVEFEASAAGSIRPTVSAIENQERTERQKEALARAKEHPKIAEATQILGARLKEIRLPDE